MNIAILGSTSAKIPPDGQAAIERLAYFQTLGLASRGHSILLFGLAGSKVDHPNVKIIETGSAQTLLGQGKGENAGRTVDYGVSYPLRLRILQLAQTLDELVKHQSEYDVILNNLPDESPVVVTAGFLKKPLAHILHLPIFPELAEFFKKHKVNLISISHAQQLQFPDLNYAGNVYNAVDTKEFAFSPAAQDYVLYLGSIGRNKNPKDAILAAKQAGIKILIGGRIKDQQYYKSEIAPLVDNSSVVWIGEKHPSEIISLYQGAKAFLFPTLWQEPFGLVLIEAMSCGTPVVAYPNGAIPEIVVDDKVGYLVKNSAEMAEKIKIIDRIDRSLCRKHVEEKFSISKMIDGYEQILRRILPTI